MPNRIEPLTADKQAWINGRIEEARKFVDAFSPEDAGEPIMLPVLDRAFAAWVEGEGKGVGNLLCEAPFGPFRQKVPDPFSPAAVIDVVGVAFGQILVNALDLRWVVHTTQQGSELAVHGLPGEGDVLVFPQELVAKRRQKGETGFLHPAYQNIARHIKVLKRARSG
jgi:hypothetical protein